MAKQIPLYLRDQAGAWIRMTVVHWVWSCMCNCWRWRPSALVVVTAIMTSQVPLHPVSLSANWICSWLGDCVYKLWLQHHLECGFRMSCDHKAYSWTINQLQQSTATVNWFTKSSMMCTKWCINPLNPNSVYIRLIFTSCERERSIYLPALHSGPYRTTKRSQAALGVNPFLFSGCWGHVFSLTSLSKQSRKGRYYFVSDRDLYKGCQTQSFFPNEGSKQPPVFY